MLLKSVLLHSHNNPSVHRTNKYMYVAKVLSVFYKCGDTLWARKQYQIYYKSSITTIILIHNVQNVLNYVTTLTPKSMCLRMPQGDSRPPTSEDIPEPSHGRVCREKFCSVNEVKGV